MSSGNIELHQLRCFVAVAKELSFRRAAERLNMTQPPLSRQIRLLEHAVGCKLLERTNRSVALTPAGASLFASATDILQRTEHSIFKARQAERGEMGEVHIGVVPSAAIEVLPQVIYALQQELPAVSIKPVEMMSYEIIEGLRRGEIDFGLTRSDNLGKDMASIRVVSEPFILALPKSHRLTTQDKITLKDLEGEPYISYSQYRGGVFRRIQQALFAVTHFQPNIVQEITQTQTVLAMINQGIGLGLVPQSAQAQIMSNLCFREIEIPAGFTSDLYLCKVAGHNSPMLEKVMDIFVTAIRQTQEE